MVLLAGAPGPRQGRHALLPVLAGTPGLALTTAERQMRVSKAGDQLRRRA